MSGLRVGIPSPTPAPSGLPTSYSLVYTPHSLVYLPWPFGIPAPPGIPPSWIYPPHWKYVIPGLTQPNPEGTWDQACPPPRRNLGPGIPTPRNWPETMHTQGTWDQAYPSPAYQWTDTCLWKHCFPATTVVGGNYWFVHFMVQYCCDWCRTYVLRNCCHRQISLSSWHGEIPHVWAKKRIESYQILNFCYFGEILLTKRAFFQIYWEMINTSRNLGLICWSCCGFNFNQAVKIFNRKVKLMSRI